MSKVKQLNNFNTSYKTLNKNFNQLNKFLVECYHHDMPSEPTVSVLNYVEDVLFDEVDGEKIITIRFEGGTDVHFKEELHYTNLSNGCVVFSSRKDDETYWLISFYKE